MKNSEGVRYVSSLNNSNPTTTISEIWEGSGEMATSQISGSFSRTAANIELNFYFSQNTAPIFLTSKESRVITLECELLTKASEKIRNQQIFSWLLAASSH